MIIITVITNTLVSARPVGPDGKMFVVYAPWIDENFNMSYLDYDYITHVNLAFGQITPGTGTFNFQYGVPYTDIFKKYVQDVHNGNAKALISIGGWDACPFSETLANDTLRFEFNRSWLEAMNEFDLDGIDIDWEWPSIGGYLDPGPNSKDDIPNLIKWLNELRDLMGPDKVIGMALGTLYGYTLHVNSSMLDNDPTNQSAFANWELGPKSVRWSLLEEFQEDEKFNRKYDNQTITTWLFNNDTMMYYTYDDYQSIRAKSYFANCVGLGGIGGWIANQDLRGRLTRSAGSGFFQKERFRGVVGEGEEDEEEEVGEVLERCLEWTRNGKCTGFQQYCLPFNILMECIHGHWIETDCKSIGDGFGCLELEFADGAYCGFKNRKGKGMGTKGLEGGGGGDERLVVVDD
ncbi:hypothetical protein HDU76_012218 [Blyttiomyces sp. JEL0837]|nr:hypothetical protein HDU76_012218 [Blyttiomyces sp. JEL0837]